MTELGIGTLLIASFDLEDHERYLAEGGHIAGPLFTRTVVLLIHYAPDEQPLGLVLNSPMEDRLQRYKKEEIARYADGLGAGADELFYWGGPCKADKLTFLHRVDACAEGSRRIYPGVYFGGDLDAVREYIALGAGSAADLRYFLGYASWDTGQLEEELAQNQWLLSNGGRNLVLDEPAETLWQQALYALGGKYRSQAFMPLDATVN